MASFAIPLLISGISAVGGALANRGEKKTTEQSGTQNVDNTTTGNMTGSTTPNYEPGMAEYRDNILNYLSNYLNGNEVDYSNYRASGLESINRSAEARDQSLSAALAARGLNSSPVAASAAIKGQDWRMGQQNDFLATVPLLEEEARRKRLSDVTGFFSSLPVGSTQQQSTTQHQVGTTSFQSQGTQTTPGNVLGGGVAGLGSTLAGLYGQGAFSGSKKPKTASGE